MTALYVHWPYCLSKCPYCDFNSRVARDIDQDAMREAYARELSHYAERLPDREISSVYFGGGTPSLMAPKTVAQTLENIAKHWALASDAEVTLEANPTSSDAEKFAAFRTAGVNRLSLGIQSLRDDALKFLGRAHDAKQARDAIELAKEIFPRTSFDLIYGRPDQTTEDWAKELREALAFHPQHISLYQLTIEPHSVFYKRAQEGEHLIAPEDVAAALYEQTNETLREAGLPPYEISNYAGPGHASRHNLTYWNYEEYIGIGAGAHGRILENQSRLATTNHRDPKVWLQQSQQQGHGRLSEEILPPFVAQTEALLMGLRLTNGIDKKRWKEKFGNGLEDFLPHDKVKKLEATGMIVNGPDHFHATRDGLQRLNAILSYLAPSC